ncbi:Phosphoserine phosphatase [Caldibacillus thermoamylovorans]|uniref:hypothetical protein n=1 Tax=Caldibacillus thermoamylovorans TaxID=35841 RepID=UPI0005B722D6|nr:hypothetical protein [Caldibacillus thermoamylovorans]KIO60192.1 Phosphoserine phosphatase [Caldibacillus thermoamylovorans]
MSNMEGTIPFYKKKWFIIVSAILILLIGWGLGESNAKETLDGKKVHYDKLVKKIKDKEKELDSIIDERDNILKEVDENKDLIEAANNYKENKQNLDQEISSKTEEVKQLDSQITSKQSELNSLTGKIQETGDAPKELPAGTFVVGKDIPAGRYKVLPVGRGSNFVVYDENGNNVVNTIVSSVEGHGVPEYITYLFDNYIIEASSPFQYVPVK